MNRIVRFFSKDVLKVQSQGAGWQVISIQRFLLALMRERKDTRDRDTTIEYLTIAKIFDAVDTSNALNENDFANIHDSNGQRLVEAVERPVSEMLAAYNGMDAFKSLGIE